MKRSLETISAPPLDGVEKIDGDENLITVATAEVVAVASVASITAEVADDVIPVMMVSEVTDGDIQKNDDDCDDGSPKRQRPRLE